MLGFNEANSLEIIHMQFCKLILGVKRSTTNMMVYSELGRLPLYISRNIRIVKYWIQLLNTDNCILKECYATFYDECFRKTRGVNWVSQIRDILLTNGFGYIWYNQNVHLYHYLNQEWPTSMFNLCSLYSKILQNVSYTERFYLTTHSTHFIYGYMASGLLYKHIIFRNPLLWNINIY